MPTCRHTHPAHTPAETVDPHLALSEVEVRFLCVEAGQDAVVEEGRGAAGQHQVGQTQCDLEPGHG